MTIEKKIKLLTITVLVLIATNVATIATIFIHPFQGMDEERFEMRKEMHQRFKEAGFTPKQMQLMKQQREQCRLENKATMQKRKELRHALHQQLLSDSPDTAEISRLIFEMGESYKAMKRLTVKQFLVVKPNYTKEQLHMLLQGDEPLPQGRMHGRHQGEDAQKNNCTELCK